MGSNDRVLAVAGCAGLLALATLGLALWVVLTSALLAYTEVFQ